MIEPAEASRKEKILDAAEKAFAEMGFEGSSLRQIVASADVNLATVYYYFESKEKLLEAVMQRRFGPLKERQLARLKQAQEQAGGQPVPVAVILDIMLSCPLALTTPGSPENQMSMRLLGRMITDPSPHSQTLLQTRHEQVRQAFFEAFQHTLPQLPARDLHWRLEFIWGALAIILCNPGWVENRTLGGGEPVDAAKVLPQMISFFAAGLCATAVTQSDILPVS